MELFQAILNGLTVGLIIIVFMQDRQLRKHYNAIQRLIVDRDVLQKALRDHLENENKGGE